MDKLTARQQGLTRRASLTSGQRRSKSDEVMKKLLPFLKQAKVIGCYVSVRDELDTEAILDYCFTHNKILAVPEAKEHTLIFRVIHSRHDLQPGKFGIPEPDCGRILEPPAFDLMLVPLSSFDSAGHRTGYGKGYYDSILAGCRCRIGLAFAEQKIDQIEADPWDIALDQVIYA